MRELASRFTEVLARDGVLRDGDGVVVALSGGMDSLVLLHLLRFSLDSPALKLHAAHFDHRMREGSQGDALWVRGLCRAWGVPCSIQAAEGSFTSEEPAREARYAFLHQVVRGEGATRLLTAHHADDQAETVLFRILRGTGLRGLGGIPRDRWPGVYRPLLSISREEIRNYAGSVGIRPREDPTNLDTSFSRNFLRHRVLPEVETNVAPGARKALSRLSRLARENEEGWRSLLPNLMDGVVVEEAEGFSLLRPAFLAYHPVVQNRLLRELFRRVGIRPGESGTRAALEFTRSGESGRSVDLPGGFCLSREFDHLILGPASAPGDHRPLTIPDGSDGEGDVMVGGRRVRFHWGPGLGEGVKEVFCASARGLEFPLRLRGWTPGDRIRRSYGRKKLKKLFAEAKIPVSERERIPVLVDGKGRVLWVENPPVSAREAESSDEIDFYLGIPDAHQS